MRCKTLTLALLTSCPGDDADPSVAGSTTGSIPSMSTTTTSGAEGLDSTGGRTVDHACVDDFHGNQEPGAALSIHIEPGTLCTEIPELVVCHDEPDFFMFEAPCPGYLGIELRRPELESEIPVPDLVLHDGADQPIEIMGDWRRFFLKPLHLPVEASTHVFEVRHASGPPEQYGLTVFYLSRCGP